MNEDDLLYGIYDDLSTEPLMKTNEEGKVEPVSETEVNESLLLDEKEQQKPSIVKQLIKARLESTKPTESEELNAYEEFKRFSTVMDKSGEALLGGALGIAQTGYSAAYYTGKAVAHGVDLLTPLSSTDFSAMYEQYVGEDSVEFSRNLIDQPYFTGQSTTDTVKDLQEEHPTAMALGDFGGALVPTIGITNTATGLMTASVRLRNGVTISGGASNTLAGLQRAEDLVTNGVPLAPEVVKSLPRAQWFRNTVLPSVVEMTASEASFVGLTSKSTQSWQDIYSSNYGQNPVMSLAFLGGFTSIGAGLRHFQMTSAASSIMKKNNEIRQAMAPSAKRSITTGTDLTNVGLGLAYSEQALKEFGSAKQAKASSLSQKLKDGLITTKEFDDANGVLSKIEADLMDLRKSTISKLTKDAEQQAMVSKAVEANPYLFIGLTDVKELTPKAKKGDGFLKAIGFKEARAKVPEKRGTTRFIVDTDGTVKVGTEFDKYSKWALQSDNYNVQNGSATVKITKGGKTIQLSLASAPPKGAEREWYHLLSKVNDKLPKAKNLTLITNQIKSMVKAKTVQGYDALLKVNETNPSIFGLTPDKVEAVHKLREQAVRKRLKGWQGKILSDHEDLGKVLSSMNMKLDDADALFTSLASKDSPLKGISSAGYDVALPQVKPLVINVNTEQLKKSMDSADLLKAADTFREARINESLKQSSFTKMISDTIDETPMLKDVLDVELINELANNNVGGLFMQANQNNLLDSTLTSFQRLNEQVAAKTIQYLEGRLAPLREATKGLTDADKADLNRFKRLINLGADVEINDGLVTLRVTDEGVLTARNEVFLANAERVGDSINDMQLSPQLADWLEEYNSLNKEYLEGRNAIRGSFNDTAIKETDYWMPPVRGKVPLFIYDDSGELVYTAVGNTMKETKLIAEKNIELLKAKGKGSNFYIRNEDEVIKASLMTGGDVGKFKATGSENFNYSSGRTTRTTIGEMAEFDNNITQSLYDELINNYTSLKQDTMRSYFRNEIAYADNMKSGATNKLPFELYKSYASGTKYVDKGSSIVTSTWHKLSEVGEKAVDWGFEQWYNAKHIQENKMFKSLIDEQGIENILLKRNDLKTTKDMAFQISKALNTSLLRFLKGDYIMLNILGTVPMSKLVVGGLRKGKYEDEAQWLNRIGAYGVSNGDELGEKLASYDWGNGYIQAAKKSLSKNGKSIIEQGVKEGYLNENVFALREILGDPFKTVREGGSGKVVDGVKKAVKRLGDASVWAGDKSEQWSKSVSYVMGYDIAEKAGMQGEKAKHLMAKQFSEMVVGNYSYFNRPSAYSTPFASMAGIFKTYQTNALQNLFTSLGVGNQKAFAQTMGIQTVMFGTQSVPGAELIMDVLNPDTYGQDSTNYFMNKFGIDATAAKVLNYGALSTYTGFDIASKGDLGFTRMIPGSVSDLTPVYNMMKSTAQGIGRLRDRAMTEEGLSAEQALEINSVYNPMPQLKNWGKVLQGYSVDRTGAMLESDFSAGRKAGLMLGFNDLKQRQVGEKAYKESLRESIQAELMDKVRESTRSAIRINSKNGDVEILVENFANAFFDYVDAGGDPSRYKTWYKNQMDSAMIGKLERQIKLKGTSKQIENYHDMGQWLNIYTD